MNNPFLFNQQYPYSIANQPICQIEVVIVNDFTPPSRFRRKKGYTGKTAQWCNKNYKKMPPEF